jgi:hypothetical protein
MGNDIMEVWYTMKDAKTQWLQFWNVFTFVLMVVMNALANIIPINGMETGAISDKYGNLFAPAGITFSIWGVIYLLLASFIVYQIGWLTSGSMPQLAKKISGLFILSSVANAAWILCWHYELLALSLVVMIVLLISLIAINRIIQQQLAEEGSLSRQDRMFIRLPFSVYFGWITVATIANVTAMLVSWGWNGWGIPDAVWTIGVVIVGLAISGTVVYRNRDIAYGLVIVWAYIGIVIKHMTEAPVGFGGQYGDVIAVVSLSIVIMSVLLIYVAWLNRRSK